VYSQFHQQFAIKQPIMGPRSLAIRTLVRTRSPTAQAAARPCGPRARRHRPAPGPRERTSRDRL